MQPPNARRVSVASRAGPSGPMPRSPLPPSGDGRRRHDGYAD